MIQKLSLSLFVASVLWGLMFSPWTAPHITFWYCMGSAAIILSGMALVWGRPWRAQLPLCGREILIGVLSACVLWLFFLVAHWASTQLFSFASSEISSVYAIREGANPLMLGLLLLLLVGPAEEIFWRGFVQRTLAARFGATTAWLLASIVYALVHLWAWNLMLILAALVCGLFWGALYRWRGSLTAALVSHALWDVGVFILFPVGGHA